MDNANSKIPNIIYSDGSTTIGQLNIHQDFLDFKVDNEYCVRNPRRFTAYQRAGYSLYLIDNGMEDDFVRYAGLMIKKGSGQRIYWGMDDIPMNDSGSREFESTLTPQSLNFINQLCNNLKNKGMNDSKIPRFNIIKEYNQNNCNRNMRNKKVVRLTESQMRNIIAESVKRILREAVQPEYFVKCVECYTKDGQDIVFVAALSETGGDKPAIRRVMKEFPNFEIIDVNDVSGSIKVGDMTRIQQQFCNEGGVMIVDDAIRNVDDLEWYGNVDDLEFDEY